MIVNADLVLVECVAADAIELLAPLVPHLAGPVQECVDAYLTVSLDLLLTAKRQALGLPTR